MLYFESNHSYTCCVVLAAERGNQNDHIENGSFRAESRSLYLCEDNGRCPGV